LIYGIEAGKYHPSYNIVQQSIQVNTIAPLKTKSVQKNSRKSAEFEADEFANLKSRRTEFWTKPQYKSLNISDHCKKCKEKSVRDHY